MTDKNVWFITGAGRGLGLDIAKAVLAAGHSVIATGRDPAKVESHVLSGCGSGVDRQVGRAVGTARTPPIPVHLLLPSAAPKQ